MAHGGYTTDEDEELACETLVGCIEITDGNVFVEHRQTTDTVEDHFWSRAVSLLIDMVCPPGTIFTYAHLERLYDLLSSHTMSDDVRRILDAGDVTRVLRGSGLAFHCGVDVFLDEDGLRTGDLTFKMWTRNRPHARRTPPPPHTGPMCIDVYTPSNSGSAPPPETE